MKRILVLMVVLQRVRHKECELNISAFDIAQRFVGIKEVGGSVDNPQIMAMLKLDDDWPEADDE